MSMCRADFCVVGRGCLPWPVHSVGNTLLAFALLYFVLQGQICLLLHYLSTSYFCIQVPYDEKDIFFGVSSRRSCKSSRTIQLELLWHYWLGHRLGLLWYWMVCLGNEQRSFCHFWDCTSDSSVDYEDYSISSKGFLPTVVDIMVICRVYEDL